MLDACRLLAHDCSRVEQIYVGRYSWLIPISIYIDIGYFDIGYIDIGYIGISKVLTNQYDIGRRGCTCGGLCEVEVALTILKLTQTGRRTGGHK